MGRDKEGVAWRPGRESVSATGCLAANHHGGRCSRYPTVTRPKRRIIWEDALWFPSIHPRMQKVDARCLNGQLHCGDRHPRAPVRRLSLSLPLPSRLLEGKGRFRGTRALGYLAPRAAAGSQIGGARGDPTLAALPDRPQVRNRRGPNSRPSHLCWAIWWHDRCGRQLWHLRMSQSRLRRWRWLLLGGAGDLCMARQTAKVREASTGEHRGIGGD